MTKEFSNVRNYIVRIAYNECTQAAIPVCSPQSCLIRWYNEPGDITKEFLSKANQFHVTFHGLKITNWFIFLQWNTKFTVVPKRPFAFFTAKCKILKTVPKRPFVFHSIKRNLDMYSNCHSFFDYKQSRSFWQQIKKSKVASKLRFVFWRRNTKFEVIPKRPFVFY